MEKKTLFLHIPRELIIEILVRLQVKYLIRFKCVCKLWFSLISDPQFAKSHFQLTAHTRRFMCMSLLRSTFRSTDSFPTTFRYIDFEQFLNDDLNNDPASFNINFSLPKSNFPYVINGSCRGFLFMYHRLNFYICNPCTGFRKQIPLSPFASILAENSYSHFNGFGYDQSRDDYLIVVFSRDRTVANVVSFSSHVEFFSFRDNKWREIEGTHCPCTANYSRGMLYNEAIHWLSVRHDLQKDVIVVFDLTERKLLYINLPDDCNLESQSHGLWEFCEHLSFWAMDNGRLKIWVMKEYKVHSSWITIGLSLHPITNNCLYPLYCTKNGDIIGISGRSTLVKYNDKGQLLRHRSFSNNPPENVIMYTESLLSLPGDNEQV